MTRMIFLVVLCISMSAIAGGNAVAGDRYAFLVGVRNYDPASFVSLRYTEDDVTGLASALKRSGYDSSNVVLMTQSEGANNFQRLPLAKQIRDQLQLLLSELQPDDTLIVAFSGHGVQFEGEDTIYFCPMDASLADKKSLVSLTEVYSLLADERLCKAGTKVLLVDACRNDPRSENLKKSGGLIELSPAGVGVPPEPPGGVVAFFSCSKGQVSHEHPDLKHGIFANFLIDAFQGKGDLDGDGEISLAELEQYSVKQTQKFARTKLGVSQLPERRGVARGVASLGRCLRLIDGAVPGLTLTDAEKTNRKKRATELLQELERRGKPEESWMVEQYQIGLAYGYALLGDRTKALEHIPPLIRPLREITAPAPTVDGGTSPPVLTRDSDGVTNAEKEINESHFVVLGLLTRQVPDDPVVVKIVASSLAGCSEANRTIAQAVFRRARTETFKRQGPKSFADLPSWLDSGEYVQSNAVSSNIATSIYRLFADVDAAEGVRNLFPEGSGRDGYLAALAGDVRTSMNDAEIWDSAVITPFAIRGEMENVEQCIRIFKLREEVRSSANSDAQALSTYYLFAIEAFLDFGYEMQAEVLVSQLLPSPPAAGPAPSLSPFRYPFCLIENKIASAGQIYSESFQHALGRMAKEADARRLNKGRIEVEYVFGLLADID